MGTAGRRKCCHCGVWFKPHPRRAALQEYCLKSECRTVSKRASQQKWCRKNPGYFHGDAHVKKVQAWRREHPGYWRAKGAAADGERPDALQDLLTSQGFHNSEVTLLRNCLSEEISRPLQDLILAQSHFLKGLTSMITGDLLQEDIERTLSSCYQRGQRIGGMTPWMPPQEVSHERARTDCSRETPAHSVTV